MSKSGGELSGGVYITVADPSADANAALMVRELKAICPNASLRGVGGPQMAAAGVSLMADTTARSAMGLAAMGRYVELQRLKRRVREDVRRNPPELWICIDSWSMNVHFARLAKELGIPVLYYVAPQTWASREARIGRMKSCIDRLACILPFEEKYFRAHGVNAEYVGHPLWDRIGDTSRVPVKAGPAVTILPGSRRGVTRANWPRLQRVMDRLRQAFPGVQFKVPLTTNSAPIVLGQPLPPDVDARLDAADEMLRQCDLAICVSGTAALHVAAYRVPMIVVYYGNRLAWHLLGRWIIRTRTYSLVNLLAGGAAGISQGANIAPEFIPWNGSVDAVADLTIAWLRSPAELAARSAAVARVVEPLARAGASRRVATIAAEMLGCKLPQQAVHSLAL